MTILGIDPGLTGGLALLSKSEGIWLEPMPRHEFHGVDAVEIHRLLSTAGEKIEAAYVEDIFAMPKAGAHSMMRFGKAYGIVVGVLGALDIPVRRARSQNWQKLLYQGCPSDIKGKERSSWAFGRVFPGVDANAVGSKNLHMGMVEAALIAEYGRREFGYE